MIEGPGRPINLWAARAAVSADSVPIFELLTSYPQVINIGDMDTSTLIFIFASSLMAVIFGFSLLLIKRSTSVPGKIVNYDVDAAVKLAELEGHVNSLRLQFTEVIDRLERWSKREKQRSNRELKVSGDVLPTDKDLPLEELPVNNQPAPLRMTPMQRLKVSKGR